MTDVYSLDPYDMGAGALTRRGRQRAPLRRAGAPVRALTPEEQRAWEIEELQRRAAEARARHRFGPIDLAPVISSVEEGAPSVLELGRGAWNALAPGAQAAIDAAPDALRAAPGAIANIARATPGAVADVVEAAPQAAGDMFAAIPDATRDAALGLVQFGADQRRDFEDHEGLFRGGYIEDLFRGPARDFEVHANELVGARATGDEAAQDRAAIAASGDQVFNLLNASVPFDAAAAGGFVWRNGVRGATRGVRAAAETAEAARSAVRFSPSNIRSRFAAFDPARSGESDLLASVGPIAAGAGLGAAGVYALMPEEATASEGGNGDDSLWGPIAGGALGAIGGGRLRRGRRIRGGSDAPDGVNTLHEPANNTAQTGDAAGTRGGPWTRRVPDETRQRLLDLAPAHTMTELAALTGVNSSAVRAILERAGVRAMSAAARPALGANAARNELIMSMRSPRRGHASGRGAGVREDDGAAAVAAHLRANGYPDVTVNTVVGVWARADRRGAPNTVAAVAESPPEMPSDLDRFGITPERRAAISARGRNGAGAIAGLAIPAAGAGALALSAGDAEAQAAESPELLAARAERERAQENLEMIDRALASGNPDDVRRVQRLINERDDGVIGEATRTAARARREQLRADVEGYDQRIASLEQDEASRATRAGPLHEALRTLGPTLAPIAGLAIGHGTRIGALRAEGRRLARRNTEADALISDAPLVRPDGRAGVAARAEANAAASARAANVNEFWRMGDAGERVPFRAAQTERGFAVRPGAAEGSELFPPATGLRAFVRPMDAGVTLGAGADVIASSFMLDQARARLAEAEEAASANPNEANLARVEALRDEVYSWEALQRFGYGVAAGRLSGLGHRYPSTRPNVPAAETERSALNQFLAPSRPQRSRRRSSP